VIKKLTLKIVADYSSRLLPPSPCIPRRCALRRFLPPAVRSSKAHGRRRPFIMPKPAPYFHNCCNAG